MLSAPFFHESAVAEVYLRKVMDQLDSLVRAEVRAEARQRFSRAWNSFRERLRVCSLLDAVLYLCDFRSIMAVFFTYGVCTFAALGFWLLIAAIDLSFGTKVSETAIDVIYELHGHVLPTLKLFNAVFGVLVGIVILNHINDFSHGRHVYDLQKKELQKPMPAQVFDWRGIKALKMKMDMKECCICLDSIARFDTVRIVINCRHYFHASCIDRWLPLNNHCPLCRSPVGFTVITFNG
eukprot:TRINITY_DN3159_c0_g1_i1.p1 TRINITY_DN3159_c0_g1~~TRINITY_DN3159_c0_g1_i1.p1  ORF type:complete len:237 (+),score=-0.24 TRINITY_DN3159_c0_g1_i1:169-879(+)